MVNRSKNEIVTCHVPARTSPQWQNMTTLLQVFVPGYSAGSEVLTLSWQVCIPTGRIGQPVHPPIVHRHEHGSACSNQPVLTLWSKVAPVLTIIFVCVSCTCRISPRRLDLFTFDSDQPIWSCSSSLESDADYLFFCCRRWSTLPDARNHLVPSMLSSPTTEQTKER